MTSMRRRPGLRSLDRAAATEGDGCISDPMLGGMGYHYSRCDNIFDDAIDLLNPEFLVYAPKNGPSQDGVARTRLAAVEYFLPFSTKFPAPNHPGSRKHRRCTISRRRATCPTSHSQPRTGSAAGCSTSGSGRTTRPGCSRTSTVPCRSVSPCPVRPARGRNRSRGCRRGEMTLA